MVAAFIVRGRLWRAERKRAKRRRSGEARAWNGHCRIGSSQWPARRQLCGARVL